MIYSKSSVDGTYNILKNDHFVAKPITVSVTAGNTVKAGTPLAADGTAATTTASVSNAVGILLYDVDSNNPNGALLIHGFVDTTKAQTHSGVTVDAATKTALPMIAFC